MLRASEFSKQLPSAMERNRKFTMQDLDRGKRQYENGATGDKIVLHDLDRSRSWPPRIQA
jgi:hypothetical protein